MAKSPIKSLINIVLPNSRAQNVGSTPTFRPNQRQNVLTLPTYTEHREDLFNNRLSDNSNDLVDQLGIHDPDFSATINAYQTVADTDPSFIVYDSEGQIDRDGISTVNDLIQVLTGRFDYKQGFQLKPNIRALAEHMRGMILVRGAVAAELVLDKRRLPAQIKLVDPKTLRWRENEPGVYKPEQVVEGENDNLSLDVATFFISFFRRNPTSIYSYSPFVAAINTIVARQQVINDLYRIMQLTGYPRVEIEILEEVLVKSAPEDIKVDPEKLSVWVSERMGSVASEWSGLRADQAYVHTDSIKANILNDKKPGASMDINNVISVLNAQNQAALKTVSTVIGRGESGVNTASTEARIFSMNADALNRPVAEILSNVLTLALRIHGSEGRVEVKFPPAELRPHTELEPNLVLRQSRLLKDLSLGLITDDEYHLQMYNRLAPEGAPVLSGTNFMETTTVGVDEKEVSPNGGPLERGLTPDE